MGKKLLSLPGVSVERDVHGVPHIEADSEPNLYRGLGWVHGTDRALQMLLTRMAGRGRLAERLPGPPLLAADKAFRRMGFHLGVEEQVGSLSPDVYALLAAYCEGVNLALRGTAPWELRLFGIKHPDPWTPADCVVLARLVGFVGLAQSQGEMERLLVQMVKAGVPRDLLAEVFPSGLDGLDEELVARVDLGEPLVPPEVRWTPYVPRPIASNNWAVGPSRTRSGRAVLSGDPHLELRLPAIWSEVVGTWPGHWVIAATMPGLPAFLMGRTDALAWTATYAFMDATDSWVEQCRDGLVRRDVDGEQTWVPVRTRVEEIGVRRGKPVRLVVHETDRGVLDGDPEEDGLRLATRWSGAEGGGASMTAMVQVLRAQDVTAGMAALGGLEMAFNWVLADQAGSIGYQMSGLMPLRDRPDSGLAPLPAWDPATAWRGYAPAEDLPRTQDPEAGFIVTANDDLNHLGRRAPINLPMSDSRAVRIAETLQANDSWTVQDTQRLQVDLVAAHPRAYLEVLLPLLGDSDNERILRDWDCSYAVDSLGATLFERWHRGLVEEVFGSVLGGEVIDYLFAETGILADFEGSFDGVLLRADSGWFGGRSRADIYAQVARRTLPGPVVPWGELRPTTARHLLFGGTPLARLGFDRGPFPLAGGRGTVQQGQLFRSAGADTSFMPTLRIATDFAEDAAHTVLAGGPSDRVRSRWYASDFAAWRAGRLKTLRP
ncbi:MAG TPA: penicillin acylase family protein [Actinomycetota bacterium]|nr:penicillin acylase family protein [Actinomycetota bacterium]